jgi:pimeloyl-ACP methyl ester carboxylesterase
MDARGHGFSKAEANPAALRSWTPFRRDLQGFVEKLRSPVVLAGHSMGATVSMELAAARPDLVGGLVLVDPVIAPPTHIPLLAVARLVGLSNRLIPISQMAAKRRMEFPSREAAIENFVGKGPFKTWPRAWIEAYIDGGTRPLGDGSVRLTCERDWESRTFAVATVSPYRSLRRVRCPITLIARKQSSPPFTRASRDAFMKRKPDTRLLLLEEVSHFMTMERPDLVKAEIEQMAAIASEL